MGLTDCPQCAELRRLLTQQEGQLVDLAQKVAYAEEQLAGRDHQLRTSGQDYIRIKRKLDKMEQGEPDDPDVEPHVTRLLKLWAELHRADRKRAPDISNDGARAAQVRRQLKKFSGKAPRGSDKPTKYAYAAERLENAIRGCELNDWAMGRIRKSGGKSFNDIEEHILASVQSIEDNEELWLQRSNAAKQQSVGQGAGGGAVGSRPTHRELVVDDFDRPKQTGPGQWMAFCGAHEDQKQRSLAICIGNDGRRLVVNCFAGCTAEAITASVGGTVQMLYPNDDTALFKTTPVPIHKAKPVDPLPEHAEHKVKTYAVMIGRDFRVRDRIKAVKGWSLSTLQRLEVGWDSVDQRLTFPIRDRDGRLVNVVRYRPGGSPKSLALKDRPRDLFPAPETIEGDVVWLVEGEPDAVTGHQLGLPAVGVPGVGPWKPDWSERFAGRNVVICFDADDPGHRAAQRTAPALVAHALSVRVVNLFPKRDDGSDLGDAFMAGVTADDLRKLAAEAPVVEQMRSAA